MKLPTPRTLRIAALFLTALAVEPAVAQEGQPRTLDVAETASWQHAATQLILPPESAGLRRGAIRDSTAGELDVFTEYRSDAEGVIATVYLYKTSVRNVPLWFDRALVSILLRPGWGLTSADTPVPTPFMRPDASVASGLRAAIDVDSPEVRSTALAVAPLGDFLVKVRISSRRLDLATLDARLTAFIEGLRWPAAASEHAAVPVEPCATPLRFRQARVVQDDMSNVLMNLLGGIVEEGAEGPPPVYCREPGATLQHGVYRADASRESYLIALGDAGIALNVGQGLSIEGVGGGGGRRYSMRLHDRTAISALPSFNRLPPPEQAIAIAFGSRQDTISVSTGNDTKR